MVIAAMTRSAHLKNLAWIIGAPKKLRSAETAFATVVKIAIHVRATAHAERTGNAASMILKLM